MFDGSDCDDTNPGVHPGVNEVCNGVDDNCNGLVDDGNGADSDGDGVANACDNCRFASNPAQSDLDHNGLGEACDLDDDLIYIVSTDKNRMEWQRESGFTTWNVYEGDLAVLRATDTYAQVPGSNQLAIRACGVTDNFVDDATSPLSGNVKFTLVTGAGGVESSLGANSVGVPRVNVDPCP